MRINYAIVFVSDMNRSIKFYRDVVGIPLKFESGEWTEFLTEGSTLALHVSDDPKPDTELSDAHPPGSCRTGFNVGDLDEFHAVMKRNDVCCVQTPKETFGVRIAQYADPDGLVFSVSESRSVH